MPDWLNFYWKGQNIEDKLVKYKVLYVRTFYEFGRYTRSSDGSL